MPTNSARPFLMSPLYTPAVQSIHIIYASTSGHTEHVVDTLVSFLQKQEPQLMVTRHLAEQAKPEDLLKGDILLLASGTWNTGGIEGQLNPHMHVLLKDQAKDIALGGKKCALIALGDERYYYTCRAVEHLQQFVHEHGGTPACDPLLVVNEPYGQEERMIKWGEKLLHALT